MLTTQPPEPPRLTIWRRLRLTIQGWRDRHLKQLPPSGLTPLHQRLMAESQDGELRVVVWLIPLLRGPEPPAPGALVPEVAPAGFPAEIWAARAQVASAERQARAAAHADTVKATADEARASATAAVGRWISHYIQQASVYERARLGSQTRVTDWRVPDYEFMTTLGQGAGTSTPQLNLPTDLAGALISTNKE